ncbi:tRNA (adenosine(37)-N6)-threonylcarbamoyltransferase complex dimerization subunit type 1 TsaB [Solirubrobacter ginsenosidimutans]|uniref:tRNA (Adenosine(37)-N6)-threonylcarbamoyltransferase complex dimerization subunit type 1 TsaB n=1 Tax=Solirubrobacter ginsenosidimutans TaxID=490573 RepID=A0A9X3S2F8_9ACTN|nr:tRNA (adenosine(37)-N6)-threonylcarbamoyltransferase complex dimerization subunit type 1 TsaB [Solirubrobacter ginsenosidimutans]MDA0164565.1 tRNA (adenosine(37)-N6)-threonylcarbamoyltransferase complex dimerization subunit type 1 TsaB [Solirubrobacter ginsenosidimutans]
MTPVLPALAVDASTRLLSCALHTAEGTIERQARANAVEALAPMTDRLLEALDLKPSDLGLIVVGIGPGSFIGTRSAVTFANVLSYAGQTPMATVSGLDSIAAEVAADEDRLVVAIEAGRGRVYAADYVSTAGVLARGGAPRTLENQELRAFIAGLSGPVRLYGQGFTAFDALEGTVLARHSGVFPTAGAHLRLQTTHPELLEPCGIGAAVAQYSSRDSAP